MGASSARPMRSPDRGWGCAASRRSTSATVASTRERHCAHAETVAASSSPVSAISVAASWTSSSTSCPSSSRNRRAATTEVRVRPVVVSATHASCDHRRRADRGGGAARSRAARRPRGRSGPRRRDQPGRPAPARGPLPRSGRLPRRHPRARVRGRRRGVRTRGPRRRSRLARVRRRGRGCAGGVRRDPGRPVRARPRRARSRRHGRRAGSVRDRARRARHEGATCSRASGCSCTRSGRASAPPRSSSRSRWVLASSAPRARRRSSNAAASSGSSIGVVPPTTDTGELDVDGLAWSIVEKTEGGVHVTIDLVGGAYVDASTSRPRRRTAASCWSAPWPAPARRSSCPWSWASGSRSSGRCSAARNAPEKAAATEAFVRDVVPLLADGRVAPVVERVVPLGRRGGCLRARRVRRDVRQGHPRLPLSGRGLRRTGSGAG